MIFRISTDETDMSEETPVAVLAVTADSAPSDSRPPDSNLGSPSQKLRLEGGRGHRFSSNFFKPRTDLPKFE